jgi:hypothetical protein
VDKLGALPVSGGMVFVSLTPGSGNGFIPADEKIKLKNYNNDNSKINHRI